MLFKLIKLDKKVSCKKIPINPPFPFIYSFSFPSEVVVTILPSEPPAINQGTLQLLFIVIYLSYTS